MKTMHQVKLKLWLVITILSLILTHTLTSFQSGRKPQIQFHFFSLPADVEQAQDVLNYLSGEIPLVLAKLIKSNFQDSSSAFANFLKIITKSKANCNTRKI